MTPKLIRYEGSEYFAFTNEQAGELRKIVELNKLYGQMIENFRKRTENYEVQLREKNLVIGNQEGIINDYAKTYGLQLQQSIADANEIHRIKSALSAEKKRKKWWKFATYFVSIAGVGTFLLLK